MGRVTTRVRRTRWDVADDARLERPDTVAVEEPLEIRVGEDVVTTTMRTPGDDFDLALGHLLTEGLLESAREVATLMHCTDVDESGLAHLQRRRGDARARRASPPGRPAIAPRR